MDFEQTIRAVQSVVRAHNSTTVVNRRMAALIVHSGQIAIVFTMTPSFALFVGAWGNIPQKAITLPLFYIMPSVLFSGAI